MLTDKQIKAAEEELQNLLSAIYVNDQLLDDDMEDQRVIVDEHLDVIRTILEVK